MRVIGIITAAGLALAGLALLVVLTAPGLAQTTADNGSRPSIEGSISGTLIAWTDMQQPEPVQQPPSAPPQQQPAPQQGPDPNPEQSPENPQASQPQQPPGQNQPNGPSQAQPAAVQTFTGTVIRAGKNLVLRTGSKDYQLDDQGKAQQFEGKTVIVTGTLDNRSNSIQVERIELAS